MIPWRRLAPAPWPRPFAPPLRRCCATATIGVDPRQRLKKYCFEVAYRSAFVRERLREAAHAPTVEPALALYRGFLHAAAFSDAETAALLAADDLGKVALLLAHFAAWFYATQAPRVVRMDAPWEWYPRARQARRRFVFHAGPTNSGKTHAALERLVAAKSGVYCAPLKALAAQVCQRVNAAGVACDLVIGDERTFGGHAEHVACTVEMAPIDLPVDVAVIDEVQLLEDRDRGWAWTRAVLGLPAREIHLCGEARALAAVKRLLWSAGEAGRLTVVPHARLVPLELAPPLGGRLEALAAGDCVVAFSRKQVFRLSAEVRRRNPAAAVSVVYGGLPYDVRERETAAFNDGVAAGRLHILVTTDAIAYGLNMNIRRIVFSTVRKFDGKAMVGLPVTTCLQVAGRAGRFGLQFGDRGYATTLHDRDHAHLAAAFGAVLPPVTRCGLFPTADILAVYAGAPARAGARFSDTVAAFAAECSVSADYFACDMGRSLLPLARLLDGVPMATAEKIVFCFVPVAESPDAYALLRRWVALHAAGDGVALLVDAELRAAVSPAAVSAGGAAARLQRCEFLYRMAEAYCWLAWRLPNSFTALDGGTRCKLDIVHHIRACLAEIEGREP
jgi:ATP-dependent RNA helicase SUPV3L1/SUV3